MATHFYGTQSLTLWPLSLLRAGMLTILFQIFKTTSNLLCRVVLRLYFHLTKVWRSGSIGIWVSHPVLPLPFHLFQNAFLGSLYAFYVYWFWFIVLFIVRIFFSAKGSSNIEDPREAESLVIKKSNSQHKKKKFN